MPEAADGSANENDQSVQDSPPRRRRYVRAPSNKSLVTLTPIKIQMLRFLAECRFLSLPQLARLCCPSERADLSEKNARRHMRALFDAGLVDVLPVSRLALAAPDAPNDAALLYGSAPNLYVPTKHAPELLHQAGVIGKEMLKQVVPNYGPKNSLFLAHELQVRDVRVWLEVSAKASGGEQRVIKWKDGQEAIIEEGSCKARPDAWFVYRVGEQKGREAVLVGLVEVDLGTEHGDKRWLEKLMAYDALFSSGSLRTATGYVNARILVIVPNARRRDQLSGFIAKQAGATPPRVWLATRADLDTIAANNAVWRRAGSPILVPLVDMSY